MKHNTCKQCKYYKDGYCKERGIGSTAWEWACALFKRKTGGEVKMKKMLVKE